MEKNGSRGRVTGSTRRADDAVSNGQVGAGLTEKVTFGQRLEGVSDMLRGAQALKRRHRDRFEAGVESREWGEWELEVTSRARDRRGWLTSQGRWP